jgi:hypothetical protein
MWFVAVGAHGSSCHMAAMINYMCTLSPWGDGMHNVFSKKVYCEDVRAETQQVVDDQLLLLRPVAENQARVISANMRL